ncbi:NAD(P)-dependent dehydrogenase, short-chain alcohol dehydrogenase family [Parafrankia irregularis]|uniref:NAD(P)-dependent dehydrogenase, short-chain alcohol dehydrogenase family n=1 Tax=Parafrankia irregularis TaxID=795642 RepID=A0A0S4QNL5_9ACTN|nr:MULTISPECIES: SDR family NAD(P)-dependent oxidoreductase [Parafrankia]MBE3200568.1 SDR family NAD(P)-dependent oxidoreductase [Parafrankia sp. CH37]CUU56900.1 NAD(P)-dependent dehydrogenase, short-chain alcohol dehydrogenase family [Parafrankia irregularis]
MRDNEAAAFTATAVVTGGNRGIGLAVASQLLHAGVRVVLVARDPARGEQARARLDADWRARNARGSGGSGGAAAGRDAELPRVGLVVGDLSNVAGVRATAAAVLDACPTLEILIHNAGIWPASRILNADGLEQAFATNHLAPFLLNHLLQERLAASRARVVQVSAGLYVKARIDLDRTPQGADFHPIRTYATTKACNLALVAPFARRWQNAGTGIRINAVHPGVIRTGLGDRRGPLGLLLKAAKRFWTPVEQAAPPVTRLALDAEAGADAAPVVSGGPGLGAVTGRYFEIDQETPLAPPLDDVELARRLWVQAAELTGVRDDPSAYPAAM